MNNILAQHGVYHIIQDGKLWAVDNFTMTGQDKLFSEWVCLDDVDIWHWLGY